MSETKALSRKEQKELEKALKHLEKVKADWMKEDEKNKEDMQKAIFEIMERGGLTFYEDEECTIETTKEMVKEKSIDELIEMLDELMNEVRTIIPRR